MLGLARSIPLTEREASHTGPQTELHGGDCMRFSSTAGHLGVFFGNGLYRTLSLQLFNKDHCGGVAVYGTSKPDRENHGCVSGSTIQK